MDKFLVCLDRWSSSLSAQHNLLCGLQNVLLAKLHLRPSTSESLGLGLRIRMLFLKLQTIPMCGHDLELLVLTRLRMEPVPGCDQGDLYSLVGKC